MDNSLPKIIVIVGPTASGKTDLAIKIAKKFDGEIISADSRQVYRGMDIGTAKPQLTKQSRSTISNNREGADSGSFENPLFEINSRVLHYLINIKNPDEDYTVAEFKKDAIKAINKIIKRGKVPILAGGTGLYVKAVTDNLDIPSVKPNPALRRKLEKRIKREGLETLYRELIEQDTEAAYIVDGKNPRRVIRALEIAIITKKPFSSQRKKGKQLFDTLKIGIKLPGAELKKRIEKRTDGMIKNGLVDEVKKLVKKYGERQIAFDAIGYREIINFLLAEKTRMDTDKNADGRRLKTQISEDNISENLRSNQRKSANDLEKVMLEIKKNTWSFAKRQMTWFRKDKEIKWLKKSDQVLRLVEKFLSKS
ncbi:tRNA (adenosine(37)-N6)-dimethylallyltransferase MiaA [Nocardioides sp.]|uniref:tRNA (adenosine(37)-N6)-dimethylallyltransferase MiaA n=1 Tax=Nocardioides sp. TaxID=35761 RepID=UPI0027351466|nr:tRNA (adenosine(37)-N6)-dimethylallyltransferase MiaA [Nocardioides sp.]MDP3892168.1 tRNA (adenosine(37)-N6)-dimethylallyltransferase MiaA [Nocardioides sp.]